MENFDKMDLQSEIISSLLRMKITAPTEIQQKTIPVALLGGDILASSQTGSGKTLAYLLPIISKAIKDNSRALVLVPTRELANQVRDTLNKVASQFKISSAVLIGGERMEKQYAQLKVPPQVIVATPGRLLDHLNQKTVKLLNVKTLVLDEMDRMLEQGMKEQVADINKYMSEKAQILMFSATMPQDIITFSYKYVVNPTRISVGSSTTAVVQIKQETLRVSEKEKFPELIKQLENRAGAIIIFVKTKRGADQLAKMLKNENHKVDAIHGDLNQNRRDRVIHAFSNFKTQILVATDVVARGIDIKHVMHVINFDLPMSAEDYLHRIGRTGRAGAEGNALSFISPDDNIRWRAIERLMTKGESTKREDMFGPKRKPFGAGAGRGGNRKFSGSSDNRGNTESRGNYGSRGYGENRSNNDNRNFGDNRRTTENRGFGDNKRSSDNRGFTDNKGNTENRGFGDNRRSGDNRGFADNKGNTENRGFGDNRRSGDNRGFADNKGNNEKRGFGDNKRSGDNRSGRNDGRPAARFGDNKTGAAGTGGRRFGDNFKSSRA